MLPGPDSKSMTTRPQGTTSALSVKLKDCSGGPPADFSPLAVHLLLVGLVAKELLQLSPWVENTRGVQDTNKTRLCDHGFICAR